MNLYISDQAAAWYEEEMELKSGDFVRFFVRYGGHSTVQQGFSLGISNDKPVDMAIHTVKNGVIYYVEEKDLWYFDQHDFYIDYNEQTLEPEYKVETA